MMQPARLWPEKVRPTTPLLAKLLLHKIRPHDGVKASWSWRTRISFASSSFLFCGPTVIAVMEARNATEAIEICGAAGNLIDVLLTDVQMPHISGIELALLHDPGISSASSNDLHVRPRRHGDRRQDSGRGFSSEALLAWVRAKL